MERNKGFDLVARVIGAAVVDDDHLAEDVPRQDPEGLIDETADIAFLIERWDYHRNSHHTHYGCVLPIPQPHGLLIAGFFGRYRLRGSIPGGYSPFGDAFMGNL